MAGIVALIAFGIFIVSIVLVFVIGFRAVNAVPTKTDLHPENSIRYTRPALIFSIVAFVSAWTFVIAGIIWIVETIVANL